MPPSLPQVSSRGPSATIEVTQSAAAVFAVITNPRTYPDWLVGADSIRSVDADWPAPGSAFHHVVGFGPLKIADKSVVRRLEEPRRLELEVMARPFIRAHVTFELRDLDGGGTCIELREKPEQGLVGLLWMFLGRFGIAAGIWGRNALALDRLRSYLVEHAELGA